MAKTKLPKIMFVVLKPECRNGKNENAKNNVCSTETRVPKWQKRNCQKRPFVFLCSIEDYTFTMLFNFSKRYIALLQWKELALELNQCSNAAIEAYKPMQACRPQLLPFQKHTGTTRFYKNIIFNIY